MAVVVELASSSGCIMRHGCAIYRKNLTVGLGVNKDKTHPAAMNCHSKCIHAEFAAILASNRKHLQGADIYVARVKRSEGSPVSISRPCSTCMKMIIDSGIKKVYYTRRDGSWTMEKL